MSARASPHGFTLLEVMVAVAILAVALSVVFSSEAGSVRMATRARKIGSATMLVRCKMGELEERNAKQGYLAALDEGADDCCAGAAIEGITCQWQIEPVTLPLEVFAREGAVAIGGDDGEYREDEVGTGQVIEEEGEPAASVALEASGDEHDPDPSALLHDPKRLLDRDRAPGIAAIAAIALQSVYTVLKPSFESQIRRATVTAIWHEGSAKQSFDVTQYLVAERPILPPDEPPRVPHGATTGSAGDLAEKPRL